MERSHFRLRAGEYDAAKEARDQCEKVLDQLDAVDLAVHASFYRVSGDYYKVSRRGSMGHLSRTQANLLDLSAVLMLNDRRADRPRPSLPTTTATRSGTSHASTLRRT